jgi:hypothetical protein
MPFCIICGVPMKNIAGIGFTPFFRCQNGRCPSNQIRYLRCPNPSCKGQAMTEGKIGLGHQTYECPNCGFAFDSLGQVIPLVCNNCNQNARVLRNSSGGFDIRCTGCEAVLEIKQG